ncbi:MAG: hypothetical protein U1E42_11900 [Rhodospirillales bacterium]
MRGAKTAAAFFPRGNGLTFGRAAVVALWAAAAAGCGLTTPYVFKADEFNRELPTFNKPRADGEPVSICFNGIGTTDYQLQKMADTECAPFGKRAQLVDQNVQRCPLLVPQEAVFICVAQAS